MFMFRNMMSRDDFLSSHSNRYEVEVTERVCHNIICQTKTYTDLLYLHNRLMKSTN